MRRPLRRKRRAPSSASPTQICDAASPASRRRRLTRPASARALSLLQSTRQVTRASVEWYGPERPQFLGPFSGSTPSYLKGERRSRTLLSRLISLAPTGSRCIDAALPASLPHPSPPSASIACRRVPR